MMAAETARVRTEDSISSHRVLIVDDDPLVREQLSVVLGIAGYRVHAVGTARDALEQLDRARYRLMIVDWEMPEVDGICLCKSVRLRAGRGEYVYVMLLTVRSDVDDVVAGFNAGADDFVVKGASGDEIIARLNTGRRILSQLSRVNALRTQAAAAGGDPADSPAGLAGRLACEYERCRRWNVPISLLLCTADGVETLDERYGPEIGTEILAGMRAEIPKLLLGSDWMVPAGRSGFVVVLPDTGFEGAGLVAAKIREAILARARGGTHTFSVQVCVGAASIDTAADLDRFRPADLMRKAEQCLAASRRAGDARMSHERLIAPEPPS